MNEGDKVVCVFVDGHYYAVPLSAPAEGDKVVCVPLEHGQIAVPSSAPAEGDHVLMVPNDMGQYVVVMGSGGIADSDYMAHLPTLWNYIYKYYTGGWPIEYQGVEACSDSEHRPYPETLSGTSKEMVKMWSNSGTVSACKFWMSDTAPTHTEDYAYLSGWVGGYMTTDLSSCSVEVTITTTVDGVQEVSTFSQDAYDSDYEESYGGSYIRWHQFEIPLRPGGAMISPSEIDSIVITYNAPGYLYHSFLTLAIGLYLFGLQFLTEPSA